ncbi:MAG: hypothetical protein J0I18_19045 [Actinobacteria bacterium]|nr:hypothetical protein [Actinomycetota bacterium]
MAHTRQSPQQKKSLDYERERRNEYGEAPHGARTSIPRNRRRGHKANRAAELVDLSPLRRRAAMPGATAAEEAESDLRGRRDRRWRKVPDTALRIVVARKLARRR